MDIVVKVDIVDIVAQECKESGVHLHAFTPPLLLDLRSVRLVGYPVFYQGPVFFQEIGPLDVSDVSAERSGLAGRSCSLHKNVVSSLTHLQKPQKREQ